jgi:pyrimidine operon attenuation protein/uracil phosphoribosyltransferase
MSLPDPTELLPQMAAALTSHLNKRKISEPRFIGIRTGGVWVAQALLETLGRQDPLGILDVSFYRDDFTQNGLHPQVQPSELPFEIEGQHLVLIDDVLMSGRTIRAALNELFDYGRPASVGVEDAYVGLYLPGLCGPGFACSGFRVSHCQISFRFLPGCN